MKVRYREWEDWMTQEVARLGGLERLFRWLVLGADGDVDEALRRMEQLNAQHGFFEPGMTAQDFRERLLRDGQIAEGRSGDLELTRRGEQRIRKDALDRIFARMKPGSRGDHRSPIAGAGGDRLPEVREWRFGDEPFHIAANPTLENALRRTGIDDFALREEDVRVHEREQLTGCATVVLLDISHSMVLYGEDRITPAKDVALALLELVRTRYPKDTIDVAVFGDDAVPIPPDRIPYVQVGPFHTNTKAALRLAQKILASRRHPNKQIFLVTDGKPSAIHENGRIYKNSFGLDEKIVNKTLDEATVCRRRGITISTFMVAQDWHLVNFVERLTEVNRGRAYFTGLDDLGRFLFVDYVANRRRRMH